MGGEVSKSHGVGITSGLSYNKGGPVVKPGPDGKPRQHAFLGGLMTIGNMLRAGATLRNPVTPLMNYLRFGTSSAKELDKLRRGAATTLRKTMKDKDITRDVIDASMKGGRFKHGLRALDLVGQGSIPLGVASFLYGPRMTEKESKEATKSDCKKEEPKAEAKKEEPKAEAKKEQPKAEAKKEEPKDKK